jgi:polar amino acid transport system substrate-binding protein
MIRSKFFSLVIIGVVGMSSVASPPAWGATFNEIQQRGKLVVAVKDNLRPLGFRDTTGNLQGLEIEIAKRLAQELLGKAEAVVLQPVKNVDRLNVVIEDKVDLAIARVTQNESRLRVVDLSRPYYIDSTSLITKDASVKQVSDLTTKAIAVLKSSNTIAIIKYALPTAKLVGVNSYEEALTLLENGSVAAFATDASVLTGWVQDYPQYRLLPAKLSSEALCIVMPKGLQYAALQERVNQAILRWQASGWLAERVAAWGLP